MSSLGYYQCCMTLLKICGDFFEYGFEDGDVNRFYELMFGVGPMEVGNFVDVVEREDFELFGASVYDEWKLIVLYKLLILAL